MDGNTSEGAFACLGDGGRDKRNEYDCADGFGDEVCDENAFNHSKVGACAVNGQHKHNESGVDDCARSSRERAGNAFGLTARAVALVFGEPPHKTEHPETCRAYAHSGQNRAERIKEFWNFGQIELRNKGRKSEKYARQKSFPNVFAEKNERRYGSNGDYREFNGQNHRKQTVDVERDKNNRKKHAVSGDSGGCVVL